MVTVQIPATTANLGPGFDALGLALSVYNLVEMELLPKKLEIAIQGEGAETIPTTNENIVLQAALKVWDKVGFSVPGVRINLINKIPVARGLGSSAAAIVGGLTAANFLAGNPLNAVDLLQIAMEFEGHPDNVAPALFGGLVITTKDHDYIRFQKIHISQDLRVIAVIPHFPLSTKASREVLPEMVSMKDAIFNVSHTAFLITALIQNNYELLNFAMDDKLHQPYRSNLIPGMEAVFKSAREEGALGVALSGAGPTLIALARGGNQLDNISQAMQAVFKDKQIETSVMKLLPDNFGVQVL